MSMIGNLARIQNDTLLKLRQNPETITPFLYPNRPINPSPSPGLLARLFGAKNPPPPAPVKPVAELLAGDVLDLDKSWHVLHFLFTGSDWDGEFPQGFLVSCGEPVGDVDVGYGAARSFTPDEVEQIAKFLAAQNEDELRRRMDPARLAELEIYPSIWSDKTNVSEEWEYFGDFYRQLREFLKEAAARRLALLVYLN